jgi:hypothetical protein
MERGGDPREEQVGRGDLVRCRDPAEDPRRRHEQAVIGTDERVAADRADRDGPPGGADPRIDDSQMHADRQVADHPRQQERPVPDRVLAHRVGEIEDPSIRCDAPHHPAADRRGGFRPKSVRNEISGPAIGSVGAAAVRRRGCARVGRGRDQASGRVALVVRQRQLPFRVRHQKG